MPEGKRNTDMNPINNNRSLIINICALGLALLFFLTACGDDNGEHKRHANPVVKENGMAYIPIDDTAFLIPEKTWLKGYARNSTDGLVYRFTLHATVPDVQPWSKERHEEMYWKMGGPGKKLRISVTGDSAYLQKHFHEVPHSRMVSGKFIEESSDQSAQGLRRFREILQFDDEYIEKRRREKGEKAAQRLRDKNGKTMSGTVFYEYIVDNQVKYFIYCRDGGGGLFEGCHLSFPWATSLEVDIYFIRDHLQHIVAMADRVVERLREFEAAGAAYRARLQTQTSKSAAERKQ
jgi:hypothetical protein